MTYKERQDKAKEVHKQLAKAANNDIQILTPVIYSGKPFMIWQRVGKHTEEMADFWTNTKEAYIHDQILPTPSEETYMP